MGKFIVGMAALIAASGVFAQANGVPPGPPAVEIADTVDVNVVNTDLNVNVTGTTDVNVKSVPSSLTEQIEDLIDAVEASSVPSVPAQVAYLSGEINCSATLGCPDEVVEGDNQKTWPSGFLISSITIGSENDRMLVRLFNEFDERIAKFGAEGESLRGPINHLTFPDPILAYRLTVGCANTVEDCEFEITVVGRPALP